MSASECLHGFVVANEISDICACEGAHIASLFSDAVRRVSNNTLYGSLANTHHWFQNKSHILEKTSAKNISSPQRVVIGSNLVHTFFFSQLIHDTGTHFADAHNLRLARMRKLISWRQWLCCAHSFTSLLDCPKKEKLQTELTQFVEHMISLRIAKPAYAPNTFSANELSRRFGAIPTKLWLEWNNIETSEWNLQNLEKPLSPEEFTTTSTEVFPLALAIKPEECADVARETFFALLKKVSLLNSPSERHGILDFTCIVRCNDSLVFESEHTLATPIFERSKLAERVFQGSAEIIAQSIRPRPATVTQGVRIEREPAWIERVDVIPRCVRTEQNILLGIFDSDTGTKARDTEISLQSKRIGKVFRVPQEPNNTLYAHCNHTGPLLMLRKPQAYNFTLAVPSRVIFAKTENGTDFFQVHIQQEKRIFWMSAASKSRQLPFMERSPLLLGYCANSMQDIAQL